MAIIPGTIPLTGTIAPTDSTDTFAITDPIYAIDGLRNVANSTERNAIPEARRRSGMLVGTQDTGIYWKLLPAPWSYDNADWEFFLGESGEDSDWVILSPESLAMGVDGKILPYTVASNDIGETGLEFKDLHLSGTGNMTIASFNSADVDFGFIVDKNSTAIGLITDDNGLGATNVIGFSSNITYTGGWYGAATEYGALGYAIGASVKDGQILPDYGIAGLSDKVILLADDGILLEGTSTFTRITSSGYVDIQGGGVIDYSKSSIILDNSGASIGWDLGLGGIGGRMTIQASELRIGFDNAGDIANFSMTSSGNELESLAHTTVMNGITKGLLKYNIDPTTTPGWDARSIPDRQYVDDSVNANNELSEVLLNGNITGGTNIDLGTDRIISSSIVASNVNGGNAADGTTQVLTNTLYAIALGNQGFSTHITRNAITNDVIHRYKSTQSGTITDFLLASNLATTISHDTRVDLSSPLIHLRGLTVTEGISIDTSTSTISRLDAGDISIANDGTDGLLKYLIDPTTTATWGARSIPDRQYVDDEIANATSGANQIISKDDKFMVALTTVLDGDLATNASISNTPIDGCYVEVKLEGLEYEVGDGVTTKACYFATPGSPHLPKGFDSTHPNGQIEAGDMLYWNGSVAGLQIIAGSRISLMYLVSV